MILENKISQSKKEDHVVVLPEPDPDPTPGMSLKDMIDALEKGGDEIKNPKYAAGRHMVFVYIYLIKKYASPCLLFNKNSTLLLTCCLSSKDISVNKIS